MIFEDWFDLSEVVELTAINQALPSPSTYASMHKLKRLTIETEPINE